jgi:NADH-quinone oxidoreductase subunit E
VNELMKQYASEIDKILEKYPPERKQSAVIPLLYLAQRTAGSVSKETVQEIAEILELSTTQVMSIIGFYTLFHQEGGRYRVQVCTDLPCALRGSEKFLKGLCERLGIEPGETTPDGLFTVEAVMCLAACDRAPMFQLQGGGRIDYHENQSVDTAMAVLEELRRQVQEDVTVFKAKSEGQEAGE